jgi:hypothetical protein
MEMSAFLCRVPSLTRGQVCNLLVQLLLGLARVFTFGCTSRRTRDHILLSHIRLPQTGGPGLCIYILQEQGGPIILLGTGFPFCHLHGRSCYGGFLGSAGYLSRGVSLSASDFLEAVRLLCLSCLATSFKDIFQLMRRQCICPIQCAEQCLTAQSVAVALAVVFR